MRSNSLLKHVTVGKKELGVEVTGRQGRSSKQLLHGLEEKRGYWNSKAEALECRLWRTRFRRRYGPIVRQTKELIEVRFNVTNSFCNKE